MTVLRLRDNRFGESGLRFVKQNDGCSYYSEKSDELDAQSIAETHREILEKYGGKTIVDLSAHANGAILDLTGSHLEKYRNEKKKPCGLFAQKGKPQKREKHLKNKLDLLFSNAFRNNSHRV